MFRMKAASDEAASGDEIIEDLKGKVRTNYLAYLCIRMNVSVCKCNVGIVTLTPRSILLP